MKKMKVIKNYDDIMYFKRMSLALVKGIFCIIICSLISTPVFSQFEYEVKEALSHQPKFIAKLDNRNSFVTQTIVRTIGIKVALSYDKKLEFGLGYNFLLDYKRIRNDSIFTLKYRYLSPYLQYNFYSTDKFFIQLPIQFGIGVNYYEYYQNSYHKKVVFSYEPAITFLYQPVKYIGLGVGTGYRLMIVGNKKLGEQFTSPIYLFKFIIKPFQH